MSAGENPNNLATISVLLDTVKSLIATFSILLVWHATIRAADWIVLLIRARVPKAEVFAARSAEAVSAGALLISILAGALVTPLLLGVGGAFAQATSTTEVKARGSG